MTWALNRELSKDKMLFKKKKIFLSKILLTKHQSNSQYIIRLSLI